MRLDFYPSPHVWQLSNIFSSHSDLSLYYLQEAQRKDSDIRLRGEDIVSIIARSLDFVAEGMSHGFSVVPDHEDYLRLMRNELETYISIVKADSEGRGYGYELKLIPGLKIGARRSWWPALQNLQTAAYRQGPGTRSRIIPTLLKEWTELGTLLGLAVEKERERHEREARHKCSWVECDKHEMEVPRSELKTCAGCGETRYCSRACQKNDWSRHKPACRRIK